MIPLLLEDNHFIRFAGDILKVNSLYPKTKLLIEQLYKNSRIINVKDRDSDIFSFLEKYLKDPTGIDTHIFKLNPTLYFDSKNEILKDDRLKIDTYLRQRKKCIYCESEFSMPDLYYLTIFDDVLKPASLLVRLNQYLAKHIGGYYLLPKHRLLVCNTCARSSSLPIEITEKTNIKKPIITINPYEGRQFGYYISPNGRLEFVETVDNEQQNAPQFTIDMFSLNRKSLVEKRKIVFQQTLNVFQGTDEIKKKDTFK